MIFIENQFKKYFLFWLKEEAPLNRNYFFTPLYKFFFYLTNSLRPNK